MEYLLLLLLLLYETSVCIIVLIVREEKLKSGSEGVACCSFVCLSVTNIVVCSLFLSAGGIATRASMRCPICLA